MQGPLRTPLRLPRQTKPVEGKTPSNEKEILLSLAAGGHLSQDIGRLSSTIHPEHEPMAPRSAYRSLSLTESVPITLHVRRLRCLSTQTVIGFLASAHPENHRPWREPLRTGHQRH